MNYPANEVHWKVGDLVIHDADHKSPEMLQRVVGYTRDGFCKTKYVSDCYHKSSGKKDAATMRKIWHNDISVLHSPDRFELTRTMPDAE